MRQQSCELGKWVEHANSQVVQTCWATMALMYARYPYAEPLEKAVKLVMSRQLSVRCTKKFLLGEEWGIDRALCAKDGSWPQEAIEGIFNKNCAISYPNFKFSFPIWMLGKAETYLADLRADRSSHKLEANGVANGNGKI